MPNQDELREALERIKELGERRHEAGTADDLVEIARSALAAASSTAEADERHEEIRNLFDRCAALLTQLKRICDEPIDERAGHGPSRSDQFMRIDTLLRDFPKLPPLAASPAPSVDTEGGLAVEIVPVADVREGEDVLVTGQLGALRKTVFSILDGGEDGYALTFTDADSWTTPNGAYPVVRVLPRPVDTEPSEATFDAMTIAMEDAAHRVIARSEDQSSAFYETLLRAALLAARAVKESE